MDDVSASILAHANDKGVPMIFKLTGNVYDNAGHLLPNHALVADLIYWQFVGGISTKKTDTIHFSSGVGGFYAAWYLGQMNPIPLWDPTKGLAVSVANDQAGWSTQTHGQYSAEPPGPSPITVVVSDTVVKQP